MSKGGTPWPALPSTTSAKFYGSHKVIHGIDIDIADGEFVTLGRSVRLRQVDVAQDDRRARGDFRWRYSHRRPSRQRRGRPKERDIAMVFQNYALYPHMTVAQNMGFALKLKGESRSAIDARVKEAAAILALEPYLDRLPKQLSGGQRQRVAMGRAHRAQPASVPVRRATFQPRRQAARADARRDQGPAPAPRHHHGLRHPRPDRGNDHGPTASW